MHDLPTTAMEVSSGEIFENLSASVSYATVKKILSGITN